jgi:hypothetical protein
MKVVRDAGDKTLFVVNVFRNRGQWVALRSKMGWLVPGKEVALLVV